MPAYRGGVRGRRRVWRACSGAGVGCAEGQLGPGIRVAGLHIVRDEHDDLAAGGLAWFGGYGRVRRRPLRLVEAPLEDHEPGGCTPGRPLRARERRLEAKGLVGAAVGGVEGRRLLDLVLAEEAAGPLES